MKIDVQTLLHGDPAKLRAWVEYQRGFQVLLGYVPGSELRRVFREHSRLVAGEEQLDMSEAQSRDFWLSHVHDVRGIADLDGTPIPYSPETMQRLWEVLPASFRSWLIVACQTVDHFRGPAPAPAAVSMVEAGPRGAAGGGA